MTTANVRRSPAGTPLRTKQQQLLLSYVDVPPTTPYIRVISLTSPMTLTEWRIVSTLDGEADDSVRGERRTYRLCPYPHLRGNSLDLSALLPPPRLATTPPATTRSMNIAD
jgi:hypothetical protein